MVFKIQKAKQHLGIVAVVNGDKVLVHNRTQLMFLRRLTHMWEDINGTPIADKEVYYKLVKEVGYYV